MILPQFFKRFSLLASVTVFLFGFGIVDFHAHASELFIKRDLCGAMVMPFDPTQTNPSAPGNIPLRNTYTRFLTVAECIQHVITNEVLPYTVVPFEEQAYVGGKSDMSGLKDHAHISLPDAGKDKHLPWAVHNYYYYSDTQEDENVYLTLLGKARIDFAPDFQANIEQVECYTPYPEFDFEKKDQNLPTQAQEEAILLNCNGYVPNLWGGTRVTKDAQGVTWEFGVDNPLLAPRLYNKGATLQGILGANFDQDLFTAGSKRGKRIRIELKSKKVNSSTNKWSATTFSQGLMKTYGISKNQIKNMADFNAKYTDFCTQPGDFSKWCPAVMNSTAKQPEQFRGAQWLWSFGGRLANIWMDSRTNPPSLTVNPLCTQDKFIDADLAWKNCGTNPNELQVVKRVNGVCTTDIVYRKTVDNAGAGKLSSFGFATFDLKTNDYCVKLRDGDAMCTQPKPLSTDALKTSCVHPDPVATFGVSAPQCTKDNGGKNNGLWSTDVTWSNCSTDQTATLTVAPLKDNVCIYAAARNFTVDPKGGTQQVTGLTDNQQYCVRMLQGAKVCTDGVISPQTPGVMCPLPSSQLVITKKRVGGTRPEQDFTLTLAGTAVQPNNAIHASTATPYTTELFPSSTTTNYTVDEVAYADYVKSFQGECQNVQIPANNTQGRVCTVVNTFAPITFQSACIQGTVNDRTINWGVAAGTNWEVQVATDAAFTTIAHRQAIPGGATTMIITGYAFNPNTPYYFRFYSTAEQRVLTEVHTSTFAKCVDPTTLSIAVSVPVCTNNITSPTIATISPAQAGSVITIEKQPNGPIFTATPTVGSTSVSLASFQNQTATAAQTFVPELNATYIVRYKAGALEATTTFTPTSCTTTPITPPGPGGSSASYNPALICDPTTKVASMSFGWASCRTDAIIELAPDADANGKCEDTDFCVNNKWDAAGTKCEQRPNGFATAPIVNASSGNMSVIPNLATLFPGYTLDSSKNYCTRIKSPGLQGEICDGTKYLTMSSSPACAVSPNPGSGGTPGIGGGSTTGTLGGTNKVCRACGCIDVVSSPRWVGDYQYVTMDVRISNKLNSDIKDYVTLTMKDVVKEAFQSNGTSRGSTKEGAITLTDVRVSVENKKDAKSYTDLNKEAQNTVKYVTGETVDGVVKNKAGTTSLLESIRIPADLLPRTTTPDDVQMVKLTLTARVYHSVRQDTLNMAFRPDTGFVDVRYALASEGVIDNGASTSTYENMDSTLFWISRPFIMTYNGGDVVLNAALNGLVNAEKLYQKTGTKLRDVIGEVFATSGTAGSSPFIPTPITITESDLKKTVRGVDITTSQSALQGGTYILTKNNAVSLKESLQRGLGLDPKADGTLLYDVPGNLTITSLEGLVGERATIVVHGNITITGNITYGEPQGTQAIPSLALIARGNIYLHPSVTRLDGVYVGQRMEPTPAWSTYYGGTNKNGIVPKQLVINGGLFATMSDDFIASRPYVGPRPDANPASIMFNYDGRILSATPPGLKELLGGAFARLQY